MNATNVKETVGPQKSIYYGMSLFQIYTLSDNLFLKRFPYPPQKVNYISSIIFIVQISRHSSICSDRKISSIIID